MSTQYILELFYYDLENGKISQNEAYHEISDKLAELSEKFETELNKKQSEKLRELLNLSDELAVEAADRAYIEGFKTGMKLTVEGLTKGL